MLDGDHGHDYSKVSKQNLCAWSLISTSMCISWEKRKQLLYNCVDSWILNIGHYFTKFSLIVCSVTYVNETNSLCYFFFFFFFPGQFFRAKHINKQKNKFQKNPPIFLRQKYVSVIYPQNALKFTFWFSYKNVIYCEISLILFLNMVK